MKADPASVNVILVCPFVRGDVVMRKPPPIGPWKTRPEQFRETGIVLETKKDPVAPATWCVYKVMIMWSDSGIEELSTQFDTLLRVNPCTGRAESIYIPGGWDTPPAER